MSVDDKLSIVFIMNIEASKAILGEREGHGKMKRGVEEEEGRGHFSWLLIYFPLPPRLPSLAPLPLFVQSGCPRGK